MEQSPHDSTTTSMESDRAQKPASRTRAAFWTMGAIAFATLFLLHAYAAFSAFIRWDGSLMDRTETRANAIAIPATIIEGLLTLRAVQLLYAAYGERTVLGLLGAVVALAPCVLGLVVGHAFHPWAAVTWFLFLSFWAGFIAEFWLRPLSCLLDWVQAGGPWRLFLRLRCRDTLERNDARQAALWDGYAFAEVPASPTLHGSLAGPASPRSSVNTHLKTTDEVGDDRARPVYE